MKKLLAIVLFVCVLFAFTAVAFASSQTTILSPTEGTYNPEVEPSAPQTGDGMPVALYAALAVASLGTAVFAGKRAMASVNR